MKLKYDPSKVQENFKNLILANPNPEQSEIKKFVEENFTMENQMETHTPQDWTPSPKILSKISDINYSAFAGDLNSRWKTLSRKIKDEVQDNQDRYSLLYLPHPVVVPGKDF